MTDESVTGKLRAQWLLVSSVSVLALGSLWLGIEMGQRAGNWVAPSSQEMSADMDRPARVGPPPNSVNDYLRVGLPDLTDVTVVEQRKSQFFDFIVPLVEWENSRLEIIRGRIEDWRAELQAGNTLSQRVNDRIMELADRYYVDPEQSVGAVLDELWVKVDILPPSMVVAQAANESAWGTSRFARQGNNLFGQWCFSEGCGIVPQGRPEGEIYEVRDYDSPALSVRSFMLNLNRHRSYSDMRDARANLRESGRTITGLRLIPYLEAYSTRRDEYVEEIRNMITFNDLQALDQ